MPFLPQTSQFILAWERHRNMLDCIPPWLAQTDRQKAIAKSHWLQWNAIKSTKTICVGTVTQVRNSLSNSCQITYKRLTYKCYRNVVNWAELTVKPVECVERIGNILSADAAIAESSYQLELFHGVQGGRCHRAVYRCRHCLCTANSSVFLPQQTRHSVIQMMMMMMMTRGFVQHIINSPQTRCRSAKAKQVGLQMSSQRQRGESCSSQSGW